MNITDKKQPGGGQSSNKQLASDRKGRIKAKAAGIFPTFKSRNMTPLYSELLTLTYSPETPISNPEGAMQAVRTAALPDLPEPFRKDMRDKCAQFILPEKPEGMEFSKDCFWREFQQRFIWHRAWMGTPEQKQHMAEWLKKERETALRRGKQWPPKPLPFRPKVTLPMPNDGKDERPGRVPRDGKNEYFNIFKKQL